MTIAPITPQPDLAPDLAAKFVPDLRPILVPDTRPPREPAISPPRESSRGGLTRARVASVVICTYTESRWSLLVRAVRSACNQDLRPAQVIVVIDHCPALLRKARQELATAAPASATGISSPSSATGASEDCPTPGTAASRPPGAAS